MSYESALQRVGELRTLAGGDPTGSTTAAATAAQPGAFQAQLALQQASAAGGTSTASTLGAGDPMGQFGLPVLSVADQYRMMGLPVPTVGLPGSFGSGGAGARMVALAQREIGVGETTANNESPRIREYRSATAGAEDTPGPWCAYFVSWLAREAGAPIGAGGNGTGYVPTLEAWGRQQGRYVDFAAARPNPGDVVIFDWGRDGTPDHTGIVERVDPDGTIHTIEGNASDVVKRRDYPASTTSIRGYVRM